jgi:hypothetical protein
MTGTPLLLGPIAFGDFEVPERIGFGGAQRLVVHTLPGGARVIDAMGRDDADLVWSGVFSGPDAAERGRLLDVLRVVGAPLPLSWDAFLYTVVIARFDAIYSSPWWVPYRITCKVIQDEAQTPVVAAVDLLSSVLGDIASAASGGFDLTAAQTALAVPGATTAGTAANAAAQATIVSAQGTLDANLASAGGNLQGMGISGTVAATGQLASLSAARGYLARAQTNLANAQP